MNKGPIFTTTDPVSINAEWDEFWKGSDEMQKLMPPQPWQFAATGRNEKCPCGSGKKYKKCCL